MPRNIKFTINWKRYKYVRCIFSISPPSFEIACHILVLCVTNSCAFSSSPSFLLMSGCSFLFGRSPLLSGFSFHNFPIFILFLTRVTYLVLLFYPCLLHYVSAYSFFKYILDKDFGKSVKIAAWKPTATSYVMKNRMTDPRLWAQQKFSLRMQRTATSFNAVFMELIWTQGLVLASSS